MESQQASSTFHKGNIPGAGEVEQKKRTEAYVFVKLTKQ